jgi:hypothetical protein
MKRFLALFLIIVAILLAEPAISSPDLFVHWHASVASVAIAAPSYTINEWLKLRRYSRAEWYRMKVRGNAPDVIGEGRMQRITPEADSRWLRKQERKAKQSRAA